MPKTSGTLLLSVSLVLAIVWAAPHHVLDPDVLSRLAMGRHLAESGAFPAHDPWTFSAPAAPFGDPEWLGDLAWYALYARFSAAGLQIATVVIACAGYVLALRFALMCGGDARSIVLLLLCTLPVTAPRMNARNDLHLLWLLPALCWLLSVARGRAVCWAAVIALLWLWANVHSSFVLAAVLLLAAALDPNAPQSRWPWVVLLLLPGLPFVGLSGTSVYRQLFDHMMGAGLYRTWLSEWRTPLTSGGWLAILPLHLLCAAGFYGFRAVRGAPHRSLRLAMFGLGCLLAYSSRRFLPLMAALMVPALAPEWSVLFGRMRMSTPRLVPLLAGVVLLYLGLTARGMSHRQDTSVFTREEQPDAALRFIAERAPHSRVFNSFDDGPWLLWFGHEKLQHYIDPRNNLGHAMLERYVQVSRDTAKFAAEAERLDVGLALIPYRDLSLRSLKEYLSGSKLWHLVYWNGWQALFARESPANRQLIDASGFRVLQPTLDLRYLDPRSQPAHELERDLSLLNAQSPIHASVIRAYSELRDASPGAASAATALHTIQSAWGALPDTDGLSEALRALAGRVKR